MGMGLNIAFAAASAALSIQSVAASQPAPLKPAGPWYVDYADSMCILAREFGEGEAKITLGVKPGLFGEQIRIVLARQGKDSSPSFGQADLAFDGKQAIKAPFIDQYNQRQRQRVVLIDMTRSDLAPLASAGNFWVRAGKQDYYLAPTKVAAALKALEACERDLLASWGMDPAIVASIATFPKGRVEAMFSTDDYPVSALKTNQQGEAGARFWVTKDGSIRDCKIVESSGSAALDARTCDIITRRGRLEPALTKGGEIVECLSFVRIRWEISSR